MSKTVVAIEFIRKRFENISNYYTPFGLTPELSMIRIDEKLVDGKGTYRFNLKKENLSPSEINLKRNDLFVCIGYGFFLYVLDPTKPGTEKLLTYAKQGSANIPGFNTQDINAFYNGQFELSTAQTINVDDMPTSLFKKVPLITQLNVSDAVDDYFDLLESLYLAPEEIIIAGTQDHKVQVTFPTFATSDYSTLPAGTMGIISFQALGYKVVGGTGEKYKNDLSNPYAGAI